MCLTFGGDTVFFKDFDPALGPAEVKPFKDLQNGDKVQILQIRKGNVLGYLEAGDYFGEGCLVIRCCIYNIYIYICSCLHGKS